VALVRGIPGDLFPVNSIGERHVPRLFVRNQRAVLFIDTPSSGRVAVVFVGALIVGRITVTMLPGRSVESGDHPIQPAVSIRRGDEIGAFHLGSTVVVLAEKGTAFLRACGPVRYGQSLLSGS
jgi:phosphatidylserine decarboxylase